VDLCVVRHAVAQKRDENIWPDDSERPLVAEGEQKFRRAAKGLLRLVPEVGVVLSSPFARRWRTAEILK
jgi:phosphohistidine phosphatase